MCTEARWETTSLRRKRNAIRVLNTAESVTLGQEPKSRNTWQLAKDLRSICTLNDKLPSEHLMLSRSGRAASQCSRISGPVGDIKVMQYTCHDKPASNSLMTITTSTSRKRLIAGTTVPHAQHEDLDRANTRVDVVQPLLASLAPSCLPFYLISTC